MCYAKPGPRCSAHAADKLTKAKRNMKLFMRDNDHSVGTYQSVQDDVTAAEQEYDATPAGMRELQRRIRDYSGSQRDNYRLRLERGVALRRAQLAAIKAEDKGDIAHEKPLTAAAYKSYVKNFPADDQDREKLHNKDEKITDMLSESREWLNTLSTDEIEAVAWFTSNGSGAINKYVSTGETRSGGKNYNKRILDKTRAKLDSSLKKFHREEPIVVYRGLSYDNYGELLKGVEYGKHTEKVIETHFKEGSVISSPAYLSTSVDPVSARNFGTSGVVLEILSKKAAPVAPVSAWDISEREMIIPRNQKYRVHKILRDASFNGEKRETIVQLVEL
jgi:hypothetical protein